MIPQSRQVLVTGASGFIGKELCRQLGQAGYEVSALLRSTSILDPETASALSQKTIGDLSDPASLERACQGRDLIFHLAGLAHVDGSRDGEMEQSIYQGTKNLLQAAINNQVGKLVYFSSILASETPNAPTRTAYGRAKLAAEKLLLEAQGRGQIQVVILRPVNVYGPGMKGNLSRMISLIKNRRLPPLPALREEISLVSVQDLCSVALRVAGTDSAWGKTYVVSDGTSYTVEAMEAAIYVALGRKKPQWHTPLVVLYAAAVCGEMLGKLTGRSRFPGLRTLRNLRQGNRVSNASLVRDLDFVPSTDFYRQLPHLINNESASPRE